MLCSCKKGPTETDGVIQKTSVDGKFSLFMALIKKGNTPENFKHTLCEINSEFIVYGCRLKGGQIVSLCVSRKFSPVEGYFVFRMGRKQVSVEIEYPENRINTLSRFRLNSKMRGAGAQNSGMDTSHLFFEFEQNKYDLFHEYYGGFQDAENSEPGSENAGIKIKDEDGQNIFADYCKEFSQINSLGLLRELPFLTAGDFE